MFKKRLCGMGKSHECCGVCDYWNGERTLDVLNHGILANIFSSSGECTCRESSRYRTNVGFDKTCIKWEKWSELQ